MATISVIVPVYKVEEYLRDCVDSILSQSFIDFELILIDDGSPDNCPDICDDYKAKDKRVIVIHKENGGLSSARNAGLDYITSHSNSEFVTFVDGDDYVDNKYLELLYNAILSSNVEVSMCGILRATNSEIESLDRLETKIVNSKDIFAGENCKHYFSIIPAKMFRTSSITRFRFIEGVLHEDDFFSNEYYSKEKKIITLNDQLYVYRMASNSIMHTLGAFGHLCAIRSLVNRIHYFRRGFFTYKRADLTKYTEGIIGFFEQVYLCDDVKEYRREYNRLLFKNLLFLPICRSSIKFRIRFLFRFL